MKKTFILIHPKKTKDRLYEAAIHEVKKYIKRETKKELPKDFNTWEFDCKFGKTLEDAQIITRNDINNCINNAKSENLDSFYLEILAKPSNLKKSE